MDPDFRPILPGDEFPVAVGEMFEDGKLEPFWPGSAADDVPVYRAMSPDVAGELYAVGRFGDESPVIYVYVLSTFGRLGPDALGRVEYVTTILDAAPDGREDLLEPGDFLDWAMRETIRRIDARNGLPARTLSASGGDPKCD